MLAMSVTLNKKNMEIQLGSKKSSEMHEELEAAKKESKHIKELLKEARNIITSEEER